MPPIRALVVEDTASVAALVRRSLEADGIDVEVVDSLAAARDRLEATEKDVVVLDVELPDGSGLDLLRVPTAGSRVPIVIVSGRQEESDRVRGLELGADDYVAKPFYPRELAVRVRRAAGRPVAPAPRELCFGSLVVDLEGREVRLDGEPVHLTDRELDLLVHLAGEPQRVFHRDDLLRAVWRSSPDWQSPKTVTEHVRRIRQKLGDRWIVTVGRAGYRFEPADG
jgi:two-component system response regulator ResD